MSLVDQNKDVARRFLAALNGGSPDAVDALLAGDFRSHIVGLPPGRAGYRLLIEQFHAGFADLHTEIDSLIGEGDRVAVVTVTSGAHTGPFLGHPPTGRSFRSTGIDVFRITSGLISDRWGVFDTWDMLRQLGLVSPPVRSAPVTGPSRHTGDHTDGSGSS